MLTINEPDRLNQLLHTLGRAYLQRQQYAAAYDKLRQLLEMNGESREVLLDVATAALGLNDTSEQAIALYEKAVAQNPGADNLKLGLANLFMANNIATPFAIELCQRAIELKPENEREFHIYLKECYEATGQIDLAREEEQKAIFRCPDRAIVRNYLENLWWETKFAEALKALQTAPQINGVDGSYNNESALTYAYQRICTGRPIAEPEPAVTMLSALIGLRAFNSFTDLCDYLVLRLSLLDADMAAALQSAKNKELQSLLERISLGDSAPGEAEDQEDKIELRKFDLYKEVLDPLEQAAEWQTEIEVVHVDWEGFLFAQLLSQDGDEVPDKLRNLFASHLSQLPDTVLRQAGNGFISLAREANLQIRAMVDFLQNLEDYNASVVESERIIVLGGLRLKPTTSAENGNQALAAMVDAAHLLRVARRVATPDGDAGVLLLRADDREVAKVKEHGSQLISMGTIQLLPGTETTCSEIVWRSPLLQLKEGQLYNLDHFEIHRRLQKHNTSGTYLATDQRFGRPVVMKVMLPQESNAIQQNDELQSQLFDRFRAVGRLSHPHLMFLHDMGEHEGMLYFAREYVDGKNLAEMRFDDDQRDRKIHALLQEIVGALMYASNQGVSHLNLKPGNIWLSGVWGLKITDFRFPGFAADVTTGGVLFPAHWRYLAPEILFGESGDVRSDIYSIGIIAYELIAGQHPYATSGIINSPKDVFKARILPLAEQTKPHHPGWDTFVMKAIQRDADKRFQNFLEMDLELRNMRDL